MATVIKRESAHATSSSGGVRPVSFDFEDISQSREKYLESVRAEAAKIIKEAHAEAAQVRQQAEHAGRESAEQSADQLLGERVREHVDALKPTLDALVEAVAQERAAWVGHWERSIVALAAQIAGRLVRSELTRRPELSLAWLREALEVATGAEGIRVRVNDADYARYGPSMEQITASVARIAPGQVVPDPAVSPGGCVIETEFGAIDAQLESQLDRITEELL
ncbi:flagellar assembly protein H [Pirellulimonas nuda]|uniref:Flagellar assembly protein FliH n=1 Tax=Pirellulimonas nuda TaxID=2528009 RepID=A0A518D9R5_9BACT|nr:FliH/SctL family protein [Pirellulimonas nuda]QDU88232.1 flagellar assembly protein H [Pirellulimonas nuda]